MTPAARLFIVLCLLSVGWSPTAHAQEALREKIRANAQVTAENIRTWQIEKVVDALYPAVVEMAGGREAMISTLKVTKARFDQDGFKFDASEVGTVGEPVTANDKIFAVVPVTVHLRNAKAKMDQNGYYLAISTDKGSTWYFLDGTILTAAKIKQIFPDFPPVLKLPERQQPNITPLP